VEMEISVTSASVFAWSGDEALPGEMPARANASVTCTDTDCKVLKPTLTTQSLHTDVVQKLVGLGVVNLCITAQENCKRCPHIHPDQHL